MQTRLHAARMNDRMAQTPTSPKIEELRFKLKTDPKSRHFYPLAEELRKIGQHEEAEKILLEGLEKHPAYLSAWIGLGRVLKDANRHREAIESFHKGLVIDPGNLVAARLIAESHLALGEKVEAIKKFKLVNALMPGDEEIEAHIEALEQELNAPPSAEVEQLPVEPAPLEESSSSGSEAASALETSPAEAEQLSNDSPPGDERQDEFSDPDTQQADSSRFQGSDESSEADSGLAMTREAGVSPSDEDIFESAARVDDEPGFGAPSTGGAMAFDEGAGGMSVLETHADDDPEDTSNIFAASLEVPAPPMDDSAETVASEAETAADGPWIDDEPQQPVNLNPAPSFNESEFGSPAGDVLSSGSAAEHDFVSPGVSDASEAVASSIQEESNEGAPEDVDASDRGLDGVASNDAMIRKLRDWEMRLARREGG